MKIAQTKSRGAVVSVVAVDLRPGLVASLSEADRGWRVTHERSGLAISQGIWERPEDVVSAVSLAGAASVDWTATAAVLREDARVHKIAEALTRAAPRRVEGHHLASPDELGDLPTEHPTPLQLREAATLQDPIAGEWLRRAADALESTADLAEQYLVELFELRRSIRLAAPRLAAEITAAAARREP